MANVYDFRSGFSIRGCNPQLVGQELERIRAEKGKLTAQEVVEEAKFPDNPLHNAFDWDDAIAAQKHRLNQARKLIVSVRVINGTVQTPIPAFVSIRSPDIGRNYVPTVEALNDEELRARVLAEVRQFFEGIQRRYAHFSEAAQLIDQLKKSVG